MDKVRSKMRVGIIQILQETNCFNPVLTLPQDFENFGVGRGNDVLAKYGEVNEIGGFIEGLNAWSQAVEPVGVLRLQGWPGGLLAQSTKTWIFDLLANQLALAGHLDGVLIALHGAMMGVDETDLDGSLLQEVRKIAGPYVPIVATVDLHAYMTRKMTESADAIVAYHTSPHMDTRQTGIRAANLLGRILRGARPAYTLLRLPMITIGEKQNTFVLPLEPIFKRLQEFESRKEVLSAAILMTQPWLDVPELGWAILIVTDDRTDLGNQMADELAAMCWSVRQSLIIKFATACKSIDRALECKGGPVIIADGADATNSGAGGDSVHLLNEMISRDIPGGALTIMVDPQAVEHAISVGQGGAFDFAVGGKRDNVFSKPLRIQGKVLLLQNAGYILTGHIGNNLEINMGRGAVVRTADVTLLLVERPGPGSTPLMYRCVGLEPKEFKIVVVKSPAGFRAEFEPFAAEIILSDCPGCASPHFSSLPYKKINRPLWPLDEIGDWRKIDWVKTNGI